MCFMTSYADDSNNSFVSYSHTNKKICKLDFYQYLFLYWALTGMGTINHVRILIQLFLN